MKEANEGELVLLRELIYRIDTNRNAIIMVLGPTGEGKSLVQLRISELVTGHFDSEIFITFNPWSTLEVGVKMNRADVLNWDDIGATGMAARDASTVPNKVLSYFLESFRFLHTVLTVSVPSVMMADITYRRVAHYIIVMRGVDYEAEQSIATVHQWRQDPVTDEVIPTQLEFLDERMYPALIDGIWFERPDMELETFYEAEKKKALDGRWSELLARKPKLAS